jgi:hypothetical protein
MIFYELFRVVNRRAALLVVFFTLVATAVEAGALLNPSATSYSVDQVFYGCYGICLGYLIVRSTFLPAAIGVLMTAGALSYLVYSFAFLLAPGFAGALVPWIQLPSIAGEGSLCLWLLIAGVDADRWHRAPSRPLPERSVVAG